MKMLKYKGSEKIKINLPSGNYKVDTVKNVLTLSDSEAGIILDKYSDFFEEIGEIKKVKKAKPKKPSKRRKR